MSFFERSPLQYTTGPHPQYTLIWLHGLGADGGDLAPFVDGLAAATDAPMRFVFPHAPIQSVTLNGGTLMPAWFDLLGTQPADAQDEAGIRRASQAITDLVTDENRRGVPSERIVLGGFSQGGALALYTALTGPHHLAAAAGLSTYLPLASQFVDGLVPLNETTPIFLAHGVEDPMIPYAFATKTQQVLTQCGVTAGLRAYPMGHTVSNDEIQDLREFLTLTFSRLALGGRSTSR